MSAEPPAPVFRKTKQGKWAVMGPIETLQTALDGDGRVEVLKKSGDWSAFTVVSLGRPFEVDGVSMCYGYDDAGDDPAATDSTPTRSTGDPDGGPRRSAAPIAEPPPRDESEPLPEFRGDETDEWHEAY